MWSSCVVLSINTEFWCLNQFLLLVCTWCPGIFIIISPMTRWGHRVAEHLTSSLLMSQLNANVRVSRNYLSVHTVMLSDHFCKVVPCRMSVERLLALMAWPYHFNFFFLMVVIRSSNGMVSCLMLSYMASFQI